MAARVEVVSKVLRLSSVMVVQGRGVGSLEVGVREAINVSWTIEIGVRGAECGNARGGHEEQEGEIHETSTVPAAAARPRVLGTHLHSVLKYSIQ